MSAPDSEPDIRPASDAAAFFGGAATAVRSVFFYVLFGTYIGLGALAHDFGFSPVWLALSTLLVWAAPAQVILISALGGGAALVEVAVAVGLSGVRFLPMVMSLLPLVKTETTRQRDLIGLTHLTAISMWVESIRLMPRLPRDRRIAFCNGLGIGFMSSALIAGTVGYYLAARLPLLFAAALLFLTPMSFLVSVVRNSRLLIERVAFAIGLGLGPILAATKIGLDLFWTGIIAGTLAYLMHRLWQARGAA
jgi:predicted branched-subunit amino acid permease